MRAFNTHSDNTPIVFQLEAVLAEKGVLRIQVESGKEFFIARETVSFGMADGVPVLELSSGERVDVDSVVACSYPIHFP